MAVSVVGVFPIVLSILLVSTGRSSAQLTDPVDGGLMCESHGYRINDLADSGINVYPEFINGHGGLTATFRYADWGSEPSNSSVECPALLQEFSLAAQDFVQCSTQRSKPVCLCEGCHHLYQQVQAAYNNMTHHGKKCRMMLLHSDHIVILQRYYDFIVTLWLDSSCDVCYSHGSLSNDTITFYYLLNDTRMCFEHYITTWEHLVSHTSAEGLVEGEDVASARAHVINEGTASGPKGNESACAPCYGVYRKLQAHYDSMYSNSRTCLDVQDQMNITQAEWSNVFQCSVFDFRLSKREALLAVGINLLLFALYYFLIFLRRRSGNDMHAAEVVRRADQRYA